jgi:solute carrier family 25 oxoglutarate transporter 11
MGKGGSVSPFTIAKEMITNGKGMRQFYKGLDSALIRQITYTTSRMGIYGSLIDRHQKKHGNVSI